jgi:tetratricopeptide (TPR) repeat protein
VLIVAACALVYANALSGPFIFDDEAAIERNPDIRNLWPPAWAMPDTGLHSAVNSRPLTSLTLALNYALGGLEVEGYHFINIALHIACALALYGAMRLLLARVEEMAPRAGALALASALLWSLHPLNSQVVNYITQRSESLMALCYLAALYCFLRQVEGGARRWQIGAVLCCALGMAAKEVMVSAPVIILLCDRLFASRSYGEALRRRPGLYAGLALSWLVLLRGLWAAPHGATIGFGRGVASWTYLLNQCQMIFTYLRLALWPDPLSFDYGYPRLLQWGEVWLEGGLILGFVVLSGVAVYRGAWWGLVGVFALLVLAPTSSFVPIVNEVGAERRMYLPLAALVTAWVVAGNMLCGRWAQGRRIAVVLVGIAAVSLGWATIERNEDYASEVSIWRSAVAAVPDNPRAQYNLAKALVAVGAGEDALAHYRRALELDPDYAAAHNNLGLELVARGDAATALSHYRRAIELDRGLAEAMGGQF